MTDITFDKYCLVLDEWFINGFNGRKAYQKYYPNSSDETADVEFNRILSIPKVKDYVNKKKESASQTLKTSHETLLKELENWAYSDITETLMLDPEQVKALPVEIRRLITKYKHTKRHVRDNKGKIIETVEVIELWFVSKERAMEMIHKHTGFYEKDNSQKGIPVRQIINMSDYKKK